MRYTFGMFNAGHSKRVRPDGRGKRGQAMLEYVLVFAALLALSAVCALCIYAVRQQSNRSLDLVASEYP